MRRLCRSSIAGVAVLALACGGSKPAPAPAPPAGVADFAGVAAGTLSGYRVAMSIPGAVAASIPPRAAHSGHALVTLTSIDFNITLTPMVFGAGPVVFLAHYAPETGAMSGAGTDPKTGISYAIDALLSNGEITGRLAVNTHNPPGRIDDFFPLVAYELNTFSVVPYCGDYGVAGAVSGTGVFCLMVANGSGVIGVSQLGTLKGTVNADGSLSVNIRDLDTQAPIGAISGFLDANGAAGSWQLASAAGDCRANPARCGGWLTSSTGCDFSHVAGLSFAGFTAGGSPGGGILQFTLGGGTAGVIPAQGGFATISSSSNNVDSLFPSSGFDYGTGNITISTFANSSGSLNLTGTVIDGNIVGGSYHYDESGGLQFHTVGAWYAYPSRAPIQGYCGNLVAADATVLGQVYLYVGSATVIGQAFPGAAPYRPSAQLPALIVGNLGGPLPLSFQQFDSVYSRPTGSIAVTSFTAGSQISGTWSDGTASAAASTWSATRCRP
jgi:hypothetical protein